MGVYLMADKNSEKTTVSVDDVRKFVSEIFELNSSIKSAKNELKKAMEEDPQLENLKAVVTQAKQGLKTYLENHTVYKDYSQKIEDLITEKKDLIAEAKDNGIPRGEIDIAIKALKRDLDLSTSTEIYSNIADLVNDES